MCTFFIHNITQKFGTIVYFVKIPYKHRNTGMGTKLIRMTELVPTGTLRLWTMATPRPILYRHSNPKKRRRIEGRSAYLKVKRDLENVYVEDFDNPWTLAVTFLRPEREYLQWLMDRGFLRWEVYCNTGKSNNARCKLQVSHSYLPPTIVPVAYIPQCTTCISQ